MKERNKLTVFYPLKKIGRSLRQQCPAGKCCNSRLDCLRQTNRGVYFAETADFNKLDSIDYDTEKIDEMALALLFLTSFEIYGTMRAWEVSNRLHEKGYILDLKNKNKSVMFTEKGYKRCEKLFEKHFGPDSASENR